MKQEWTKVGARGEERGPLERKGNLTESMGFGFGRGQRRFNVHGDSSSRWTTTSST